MTRQRVAQMRDEVQSSASGEGSAGCATSKGSAIMGALQGKGYGSVATGEEADAATDIEMNGAPHAAAGAGDDEILGMDPLGMPPAPPRRHRIKKCCCACVCLALASAAAYAAMGGGLGVIPLLGGS